MCHLILLLPLVGLVVFWLLPLQLAGPVYLAILIVSGALYWAIMRAMHRPVVTGQEELIGQWVDITDAHGHEGTVHVAGAQWHVMSDHDLQTGERVRIDAVKGLTLHATGK